MRSNIQLYGTVSSKGKPFISGMERFNHIFNENPNARFFMNIMIVEAKTPIHHVWYIVKMIVPAFIEGYKLKGTLLTPMESLEMIITSCPIFYKAEKELHSVFDWDKFTPNTDMSKFELEIAIDWLHLYCLEQFNIVVGNTKII